ncbi:DUF4112 domain-containing protein [Halogeometricum sp. CBA1124]|uniref:DUF4112 domain-containing protein n=1 Tax=Halogeometricum sp. CBA1124 TaxID=2668071 RepID=UPI00142CF691|nr:DUF4112 domain-containing protein [Halogeometricum sp. CBA1124]MUV58024.1 DUF4112 domain-containing protein [Halogeometricum sp. CBA1124]
MKRDIADELDGYGGEIPESVDRAAVERMRTVAYVFDDLVGIPGTNSRVGLDPILGSIPVVGDVVSAAFSLYIVAESARLGVSYKTLLAMLANVVIDTAGGAIPYVGTLFDSVWKANKWNIEMALSDLTDELDFEDELAGMDEGDDGDDGPVIIDVE